MAPSIDVDARPHPYSGNGFNKKQAKAFSAGRLSKLMSPLLQEWNEKPRLQLEINALPTVLQVDRAHVVMLAEQGIMSVEHAGAILRELDSIARAGRSNFQTEPGMGSIVLQVEQELIRRLGEDVAGRLPIARSRLDQGTTVRRMRDREDILAVAAEIHHLQVTLTAKAEKHRETKMISYTHLQQAQPANFGHWLLAFSDRLQDSLLRLQTAYTQTDRCPLGAVGLCGTDLPTNRHRSAELLGFSSVLDNSRLGRDGYNQIVLVFELAMVMTVLNDLCTDLHVFSSNEWRAVECDDSHCQTSSVFPQKKNPYGLETVKTNAAHAHGWVVTALSLFRNEGTSDQASRSVGYLTDAFKLTKGMLQLTGEIIEHVVVHEERWEELLAQAWVTTNRLGNILLTRHGMSYRTAHGVVARLVKKAIDRGVDRADVSVALLHEAADEMGVERVDMSQDELTAALDHGEYIRNAKSFGSVGADQIARLLRVAKTQQAETARWIDGKSEVLKGADDKLDFAAGELKTLTGAH